MMTLRQLFFAGVTLGMVLLAAAPAQAESREQADTLWAIGTAWSSDQQEVLYQEIHFTNNAELDLTTRVEYRRPDGELFAEKHIDYSNSLIAPAISQRDFRNDARVTTEHEQVRAAQIIRLGFRPHDSNELREDEFTLRDSLIFDAGFDPYVRLNWDDLVSGRRITTDFLVPARMDTVRISVTQVDSSQCRSDTDNIYCFVIRPAGLLRVVGWLVDPIHIGYHRDTRRLMSFDGISNFRDDAGNTRNVLIKFEYF